MNKTFWICYVLCVSLILLFGCSPQVADEIVLEVGPTKVALGDYENFYSRNSGGWEAGKRSSLEERERFLDLLTDYRLKLQDAYDHQLNKDPEIQNELLDYRSSLGATYIIDKEVTEPGIHLMYDRQAEEIRAQQVLISVKSGTSPEDTLSAWMKAMEIIKHAKAGANFDSLALLYSNDQTVKANRGDVYYFTGGQMTIAFENAAYSMQKGAISSYPVRTALGYHVIKILDRKPSRGSLRVRHIMARFKVSDTDSADTAAALQLIRGLQDSLKRGWDFAKLASKFSEDPGSAAQGGDLGWCERRRWVQQFDEACFKLAVGQTSGIVKSPFGYHLIRCDSLKPLPAFSDYQDEIKKTYQQYRFAEDYSAYISRLKHDFRFGFIDSTFNAGLAYLDSLKSIGDSAWYRSIPANILMQTLIVLDGKSFSLDSILSILDKHQEHRNTMLRRGDLRSHIDHVAETLLLDEQSRGLESRSRDFESLMKDYENGIVLFKAEQMQVWSNVTVSDTALKDFYEKNRDKFRLPEKVGYSEIHVAADTLAFTIYDSLTHGVSFGDLAARYNDDPELRTKSGARGLKPINSDALTTLAAKLRVGEISEPVELETGGYSIIHLTKREPPREKTFEEAGAEVSNLYQEHLSKEIEKQWVDRLKQQYRVKQYKERLGDAFSGPAPFR